MDSPSLPIDPPTSNKNSDENTDPGYTLGLREHAQALARFISSCRTPMTIGIQGDWGTGKTSLMRLVDAELPKASKSKSYSIWFNTWQYSQFSQEGRLAFSMLMNLTRKLRNVKTDGWPTGKATSAFKRFAVGLLKASALVAGTAVGTRVTGADFDGAKLLEIFDGEEEKLDEAMLFEKLREDFESIVEEFIKKTGCEKVVFYVDDLDRLKPSRAVELLEVMKNFLDVKGAIFVLAIDYDVIVRGLQERKGYEGTLPISGEYKSFFDKIIQVPYRMPTASYDTAEFLINHFKALHSTAPGFDKRKVKLLLDASIGNNPRSIKRLLNLHALLRELVIVKKKKKLADAQINQLLVLTCMQMAHARMYSLIASNRTHPGAEYAIVAFAMIEDIHRAMAEASDGEVLGVDADDVLEEVIAKGSKGEYKAMIEKDKSAFADGVRLVANELLHNRSLQGEGPGTGRERRNLAVLAKLLFDAIDKNGDKQIDQDERNWLAEVLDLAKSTVVASETAPDAGAETAATRASRVNFHHLCASGPDGHFLLHTDSKLIFRDPRGRDQGVFDAPLVAYPNFTDKGALMKVTFEGKEQRLNQVTRDIFERIQARKPGVDLFGSAERQGAVPPYRFWVVEQNGKQVPLSHLVDEYRDRISAQT